MFLHLDEAVIIALCVPCVWLNTSLWILWIWKSSSYADQLLK